MPPLTGHAWSRGRRQARPTAHTARNRFPRNCPLQHESPPDTAQVSSLSSTRAVSGGDVGFGPDYSFSFRDTGSPLAGTPADLALSQRKNSAAVMPECDFEVNETGPNRASFGTVIGPASSAFCI